MSTTKRSRVPLKNSNRNLLPSANLIGPADAGEQIQVTVRLRRGSSSNGFPSDADLGSGRPAERNYLTCEEFASKYGARVETNLSCTPLACDESSYAKGVEIVVDDGMSQI